MYKYTVPLQNTLRQMQYVGILKYTTTWGLAQWKNTCLSRARPETLCLCVMVVLTANLTESKITLPLGDCLDCTNWGRKTCLLWAAPFPRLHKWLFSASCSWMWLTSCFQGAFDSLAITDFTVELKGEANPFSVELLFSGCISTSAGEGTKILGKHAHECLCVCRCTCVLGRCEHVWTYVEAKRHPQVSFLRCYPPCFFGQGLSLVWKSSSKLGWHTRMPQECTCPCLSSTGIKYTCIHTQTLSQLSNLPSPKDCKLHNFVMKWHSK